MPYTVPPSFSLGGTIYTPSTTNYAALNTYCLTLWTQTISIDWATYYSVLGNIDGTHPPFGAEIFWASDVAQGLSNLGYNIEVQSSNYTSYQNSAVALANIKARNAEGLAIIAALNLKLT